MATDYAPATDRRRADRWHEACAAGHCRYANAQAPFPPSTETLETCPGWLGTMMHDVHAGAVLRWRLCDRHRAWLTAQTSHAKTTPNRPQGWTP